MHQVVSCEERVSTHTPAPLHFGDFWWMYAYLVMRNRQSFPSWLLMSIHPPRSHQMLDWTYSVIYRLLNAWFGTESCEQISTCVILTFSSHFFFVNNEDVLKVASHSARCHEMGAIVIDEFGVHAIVVDIWKVPQGDERVFIQNYIVPSHLETGRLHLGRNSNESNILQVERS